MHPRRSTSIGPYQLLAELGRGGVGVVYRAQRPDLPRPVALKLLLRSGVTEAVLARFEREAHALARVNHPNVVRVHELGTAAEGPYIVTDLVEGQSLEELSEGRGIAPERAAEIARDLAGAVAAIHELGIVHRDLKPANVLIRPDGTPVLLDFGLARDTESGDRLTQTGMVTGTPAYMAPEQATGESARSPDPRTDVYGIGATLYSALTGDPPFAGVPVAILAAIVQRAPEWPDARGIPPGLVAICSKAMAKRMADRQQSASELGHDLSLWLAGDYRPKGSFARPLLAGLGVLVLALAASVGILAWSKAERATPAPPPQAKAPPLDVVEAEPAADAPLTLEWGDARELAPLGDMNWGPSRCGFLSSSRVVRVKAWGQELTIWELDRGTATSVPLSDASGIGHVAVGSGSVVLSLFDSPRLLHLNGEPPYTVRSHALPAPAGREGYVHSLALTPDGSRVVFGDANGAVQVLNLHSGEIEATAMHSRENSVGALAIHGDLLLSTSAARDEGAENLTGRLDFRGRLWRLPSLEPLSDFPMPFVGTAAAFAPDGESVLVGAASGRLQRWTLEGKSVQNFVGRSGVGAVEGGSKWAKGGDQPRAHDRRIDLVVLDPRGRLHTLARKSGTLGKRGIQLGAWEQATGTEVEPLPCSPTDQVSDLAIAPDGRHAVLGYWGGRVRIFKR